MHGLSGNGMQISPSPTDPDRGCKVACQDEYLPHRFYLVNGDHGYFPYGTKCSRDSINDNRYCVNGKCLQFDQRNIPLVESHISLALYRSRRSTMATTKKIQPSNSRPTTDAFGRNNDPNVERTKRNYLVYEPINITAKLSKELLDSIVNNFVFTVSPIQGEICASGTGSSEFAIRFAMWANGQKNCANSICFIHNFHHSISDEHLNEQQIDLVNPIHISKSDCHNINNKLR